MPTYLKKPGESPENPFYNSLLDDTSLNREEPLRNTSFDSNIQQLPSSEFKPDQIIDSVQPRKKGVTAGKLVSLALIILSIIFIVGGSFFAYSLISATGGSLGQGQNQNFFDQTRDLIGSLIKGNQRSELKGEKQGRTNFLLIGVDSAAGLTDTMMIASYYYKDKKIVTLNIPRDTLAFDGFSTQKINAVYTFAEQRNKDKARKEIAGSEALMNLLAKEFGIEIHYWAKVNFTGVKQIVDELGGIEVNVEKDLVDCLYPTDNYSGYIRPCPSFKAGKQKMDGKTALIYARSRETTSDFDRSRRQSIVIQAILEKIKTQGMFENASKISSYLNILGQNLKTNLKLEELISLSQLLKDTDTTNNFYRSVWQTGNGILCTGQNPEAGYSITYCGGAIIGRNQVSTSKQRGRDYVQNLLEESQNAELYATPVALIGNQSANLRDVSANLEKAGFTDVKFNNIYKKLPVPAKNASEIVTMYILDDKARSLYNGLDTKPAGIDEVKNSLPTDFTLPPGSEQAKIVVIAEWRS